ncbi:MAG TPA: hypothetical protein VHM20_08075, partial [Gammaproteobacteria bacterium]|nr:hypothetical protein [Gammaproteobacteria bacterium]
MMHCPQVLLKSSGKNGKDGALGASSASPGGNGADGKDGQKGQNARNLTVSFSVDEKKQKISIQANNDLIQLPLGHPKTAIKIEANGGHGGNGGDGGVGGDGKAGKKGSDATRSKKGEDGTHGGPGGNGGHGGNGAGGGDGGVVTIKADVKDMDLLSIVKEIQISAGRAGFGGYGGSAGSGGPGGDGGKECRWKDSITTNFFMDDGMVTDTVEYSYTNSGGSVGRSGYSGNVGFSGAPGYPGKRGHVQYQIANLGTFGNKYDLALVDLKISSRNNVFEPGGTVQVDQIMVENRGPMPTPLYQPIQLSILDNPWIHFNEQESCGIASSIEPFKTMIIKKPFTFTLNENHTAPVPGKTFKDKGELRLLATLARVNQHSTQFAEKKYSFDITYPVQLSNIVMPQSIAKGERAPLLMAVKNISTQPIGLKADEPRLLALSFTLPPSIQMVQGGFVDEKLKSPNASLTFPISVILPGDMAVFAGTLKFTEDALQHINIPIIAQLQLGKMNNMSAEQRPIAEQKSEVQLSETYQYNAAADFVLVTNNNTPQDIIEEWKEVAEGFGTSMSLWNTSLYSGLSYTQKRKTDGRSLIDDMQGKVVIILNHADKDHKTYPTEYLDSMEILQAAKTANISTYVIGSHFDIKKSTLPVDPSHISVVVVTHDYLTKPNKKDLAKEVAKREKELKQQNPDKRYVSYDDFNPKKTNMPHSLFKKNWQVGTWRYAEAADKKRAHIAFRQVDKIESADHEDLYHFVKLLPFSKKLTYLGRKCHEVCKEAIIKAVLSD